MRIIAFLLAALAVVGNFDYADALEQEAMEKEARPARAWEYLGELPRPADLNYDCLPEDRISISYNSGIYHPWRAFCYGRPE